MLPIADLADQLHQQQVTSLELVEDCLSRIEDEQGEGPRTILFCDPEKVRFTARKIDQLRKLGKFVAPLAGIPISVKDLFDVTGEITTAGSIFLKKSPPAKVDAPSIKRLRDAGLILIGRTNMTEFAYSGLGLNAHYGTPRNPFDRKIGRIPGGSSSGAAVSVTDGMAAAAIGTDTGGSVRIPSALCGLVGFKPTARRIPTDGVYPLCPSLDSIGPLATSVNCCALLDDVLSGASPKPINSSTISTLKLAVPQTLVLNNLDPNVSSAFEIAVKKLSMAGAKITDIPFKPLDDIPKINANGGIYAEAWAVHKEQFNESRHFYDPRVAARIEKTQNITSEEYEAVLRARKTLIAEANKITSNFDALILPTTPSSAPKIIDLENDSEAYIDMNSRMLRNSFCFNFLDRCGLSIPIHPPGSAPCGLMIVGETMGDRELLGIGQAIEKVVKLS